jgi:hypothetical protein
MNIETEAETLIKEGFALARISQGGKNPMDERWTLKSMRPCDFRGGYSLSIMGGPLSGGLVILDLDDNRILEPARRIMPHTDMKDGRKGREEAHWYYRVECDHWQEHELPSADTITGKAMRSGQYPYFMGSRRISGLDNRKFDVIGAGGQVVAPPSMHKNGVRREWVKGHRRAPKVIKWSELKESLNELALSIGYKKPSMPKVVCQRGFTAHASEPRLYRAKQYLRTCSGGRGDGSGGGECLKVCGAISVGFGLGYDAYPLLMEWSNGLPHPYKERDIQRAIKRSIESSNRPMGYLLGRAS